MKALVVGAAFTEGSPELLQTLADGCTLIIAADAAGEWCLDHGVQPDIVVGDFDSSVAGAAARLEEQGIEVRAFPVKKDASDLDLAVDAARQAGASHVVLTCCLAGRLDHTVAALGALAQAADIRAEAHEPSVDVWAVDAAQGERAILLPAGDTVSVFAVGKVSGVCLSGFEYPLEDASLPSLSSLGLSNRILTPPASVTVKEGTVLVVHQRDVR